MTIHLPLAASEPPQASRAPPTKRRADVRYRRVGHTHTLGHTHTDTRPPGLKKKIQPESGPLRHKRGHSPRTFTRLPQEGHTDSLLFSLLSLKACFFFFIRYSFLLCPSCCRGLCIYNISFLYDEGHPGGARLKILRHRPSDGVGGRGVKKHAACTRTGPRAPLWPRTG